MKIRIFDGRTFMIVDLIKFANHYDNSDSWSLVETIEKVISEAKLNKDSCEITSVPIKKGA